MGTDGSRQQSNDAAAAKQRVVRHGLRSGIELVLIVLIVVLLVRLTTNDYLAGGFIVAGSVTFVVVLFWRIDDLMTQQLIRLVKAIRRDQKLEQELDASRRE